MALVELLAAERVGGATIGPALMFSPVDSTYITLKWPHEFDATGKPNQDSVVLRVWTGF